MRTTVAPSPTVTSVSVVSGPISQRPPMRVAPEQLGARLHDGVAADAHVDVDPGAGGVDDRDACPLVRGHDATVQLGGQLGQLHAVVDACHQRGVVDMFGAHDAAVLPDDRDDVGEVELLLGVVRLQPVQR